MNGANGIPRHNIIPCLFFKYNPCIIPTIFRDKINGSIDIFFKRTKERDAMYEKVFENRIHQDGKRVHCSMYSRRYIDWRRKKVKQYN